MKKLTFALCLTLVFGLVRADQTNVAEDDASREAYNGGFDSGKNGGSGFGEWKMTTEGNDENRHSGFFVATTQNNSDLNGIAHNDKAWASTPTAPASNRPSPTAHSLTRSRSAIPFPS
jgi:hypothetical protein